MTDSNDSLSSGRRVRALHELRPGLRPSRDLWPDIASRIRTARPGRDSPAASRDGRRFWSQACLTAAAAAMALLAVGIWIGRSARAPVAARIGSENTSSPDALTSACLSDARFLRERTGLLSAPADSLAGLPPESRERVLASLVTIHNAVQDIEAALARDSANPLLQDMLLHTCQDETRVLTEVHDAGTADHAGRGI